ncbi:MAG TPA: hypothetical protein VF326_15180 [Anaerolineaceae bacterium]
MTRTTYYFARKNCPSRMPACGRCGAVVSPASSSPRTTWQSRPVGSCASGASHQAG